MPSRLPFITFCFLAVLLLVPGAACSKKADLYEDRKPVHSVKGKVLYQNKPAGGAQLIFFPEKDAPDSKDPKPRAEADTEGNFKLTTYESDDGAPAGSYIVTIVWPGGVLPDGREEPEDKLLGRYATKTASKLRAEIKAGPNELPPFQLK